MDTLTVKNILVISQTQNSDVKNVLYKDHVGKLYYVLSRDNAGKTHHVPHTTKFDFTIKYRVLLHLVHTTTYNSMNDKQPFFTSILYIHAQN